jgi:SGNH domain (fused to AT3 domains)
VRGKLLAAACLLAAAVAVAAAPASAVKTCFGAAARDPVHPCFNASKVVAPTVEKRDLVSESPCRLTNEQPAPVCAFGTSRARARGTIALVGDSHALHWRAALDVVARKHRWAAYSVTAPGCLFSEAVTRMGVGAREACIPWYRSAQRWFRRHPEVDTVFVSQNATTPLGFGGQETNYTVKTDGFRDAWQRLPRTVKHVIVLRDTPDPVDDTFTCVTAAIAAGRRPGPACPTPRGEALHSDLAVATTRRLHSSRYEAIDLTNLFCGPSRCYPAIGGLLVYRDVLGHMTIAYSTSLGHYVDLRLRALMANW